MKRLILVLIIQSIVNVNYCQQEQLYTHYDMNSLSINPAYAGSNAKTSLSILSRRQWTNFSGAPDYNTVTFSQSLNNDFAVGFNIKQGTIGSFKNTSPLNELNIAANLAYNKTITKNLKLAVGIKLGYFNYTFDISKLDLYQQTDPIFSQKSYNINAPSTGFGSYLYSNKGFIGISCPQIIFVKKDELNYSNKNHYIVTAGQVFDVNPKNKIKVTSQVRYAPFSPIQMDVNAHFIIDKVGSIGTFIRTEGDVGLMFMAEITKNLKLFYSWDSKLKPLNSYIRYSHEFGLQYFVPFNNYPNRIVIPRYF